MAMKKDQDQTFHVLLGDKQPNLMANYLGHFFNIEFKVISQDASPDRNVMRGLILKKVDKKSKLPPSMPTFDLQPSGLLRFQLCFDLVLNR